MALTLIFISNSWLNLSESSVSKHPPPGEGELVEHAIWPKFTLAYVELEYMSTNLKMTALKVFSTQFVVYLMGVKHEDSVIINFIISFVTKLLLNFI